MSSPRKPMRKYSVLIVDSGQGGSDEIMEMVAKTGDYRAERATIESVISNPLAHSPDIVVLDLMNPSNEELEVLVEIRGNYGDVPVIIVSEALDDVQMRKLLKLKIHDWHRKPLTQSDFHTSLNSSIRNAKQLSTRVHAVISAMGGAGGTTVAISVADALARKLSKQKESVGLFDLDFSSGSCGMMLNLSTTLNLDSVITHPERIDHEFVSLIQQRHAHDFNLYSFKRRDFVTHLNGYEVVLRLLDAVTMEHAHTVLDVPYYEVDWAQDVLSAVNTVTVVCELNIPSIKHALDLLKTIRALSGAPKQVNVLINKVEAGMFKRSRIPDSKLKELFGDVPYRMLPRDDATFAEALDRGVVPSDVNARSKFEREIGAYVSEVMLNEKASK
ncbi:pilus assembly protein [Paragemmobacter straminiformis]|uniref:Pilus assembly protein n=1 Tax=Paragemmobacter straminiformis TaxID=2045119 RepID=A0A842IEC7_9RHOB|nr:pilus assembly protein [Gemmobacter straminiformis]MBC2837497.1 pilus assembly protein [Gemmobacter straminiformis]